MISLVLLLELAQAVKTRKKVQIGLCYIQHVLIMGQTEKIKAF